MLKKLASSSYPNQTTEWGYNLLNLYLQITLVSLLLFGAYGVLASASLTNFVPRLSVQTYHQGTIMPIYLTPGRSAVIDFPCAVTKASGGTGGDLHTTLATSLGNEVDLSLDSAASRPTSLIVRCKERVFVFDIIPSKNTHQEYIKIKESRGVIKYHQKTVSNQDDRNGSSPLNPVKQSSGENPFL